MFGETLKPHSVATQPVDRPHHLDEGAAQPVELPHDEYVIGPEIGEGVLERRPHRAGPARLLLLEDARASGLGQRVALQVEVLIDGRDAGVADLHVSIVANTDSRTIEKAT